MNERLQELLEQSTNPPWDGELGAAGEFNLEKFSELLIRDCYSVIIKSQRGHFNPATSWDAVKQHFGVEE